MAIARKSITQLLCGEGGEHLIEAAHTAEEDEVFEGEDVLAR